MAAAWTSDTITLAVPGFASAIARHKAYMQAFLDRNRTIGRHAIRYDLTQSAR